MRLAQQFAAADKRMLAAAVWLVTFTLSLLRIHFLNDHFDRISRGRQILAYGDRPFADFFDPGYFLTLYVSALGQAASGGGLIGEALISCAAIATASALTFRLAESVTRSSALGLAAAAAATIVAPRYYDYDKVLFYTAGLALCWRYADHPTRGRALAAGLLTALAALFRYDNGLFVCLACVAAIAARHWRSPGLLLRSTGVYVAAVTTGLLPAGLFVHATAGLPEAVRQIGVYAAREGRRSELLQIPALALDEVSMTYVLIAVMAPIAIARLAWHARRRAAIPGDVTAKIIAASVLGICVTIFILRDPIAARLGAGAPAAAILAAWLVGGLRDHNARSHTVVRKRSPARIAIALVLLAVAALLISPGPGRRLLRAPAAVARRLAAVTSGLGPAPTMTYFPDNGALSGLATYLRSCTTAEARVLVTWFAPEIFFFAQRGFAGGMLVFLGEHWSSDEDQRRTIARLEAQRAPLAIVQAASDEGFRRIYPRVAGYLDSRYRDGGASSFGDPRVDPYGYRVLIRSDMRTSPIDPKWNLPCPAESRAAK